MGIEWTETLTVDNRVTDGRQIVSLKTKPIRDLQLKKPSNIYFLSFQNLLGFVNFKWGVVGGGGWVSIIFLQNVIIYSIPYLNDIS